MKIEIFEHSNTIMFKDRTFIDPVDPILERITDSNYILSFKQLDIAVLQTRVHFSPYYSRNYIEIDGKRYNIDNIPENFDKINALLEEYKLLRTIEKLP